MERLIQREWDLSERHARSYLIAGDKKAVGLLADLKIDFRERQEAVARIISLVSRTMVVIWTYGKILRRGSRSRWWTS